MKEYPSIPRCPIPLSFPAYVFNKYDGSNLRFEWTRKGGWSKFGTRHRLFDKDDNVFGCAIKTFKKELGNDIEETLRKEWPGARSFIIFCEFFGPNSFAGHHIPSDNKELKLFDVNPYQQGIIGPEKFLALFKDKSYSAKFLGKHVIDSEFIEDIRNKEFIDEPHYEGVVCKWGDKHTLGMIKIKTKKYLEEIKRRFGDNWHQYE